MLLLAAGATAQDCLSVTFTSGRTFLKRNPLPVLGASLHLMYHQENSTANIAFRATSSSSGWVAWGINPSRSGMQDSNVFIASHDDSGTVSVLTTVLENTQKPSLAPTTLKFAVPVPATAEYSGGAYTIYVTVALPGNSTTQNTVWQAGQTSSGTILPHPQSGQNLLSVQNLDFLSGTGTGGSNSKLHLPRSQVMPSKMQTSPPELQPPRYADAVLLQDSTSRGSPSWALATERRTEAQHEHGCRGA